MSSPIVVVDHDPHWRELFATIHDALQRALSAVPVVAIGYAPLGDLGVPDRYAFRRPASPDVKQNVYVTINGCLALRNHLGLRDVLRSDPVLRDEYGASSGRWQRRPTTSTSTSRARLP